MRAWMWLADFANSEMASGKFNIIGGGWNATHSPLPPFGLAVSVELPWDEADRDHELSVTLYEVGGDKPVMLPAAPDNADQIVRAVGTMNVSSAQQLVPRTVDLGVILTFNFPAGLPLAADRTYEWRLTVADEELARRRFYVAGQLLTPQAQ